MPYPALPSARRIHYEIDGSVFGWNTTGFGSGLVNVLTSAQMLALNEETPTVNSNVFSFSNSGTGQTPYYFFLIFPELVDLDFFNGRGTSNNFCLLNNLWGSPDTTNGADGTWTVITQGTGNNWSTASGVSSDWWRSQAPRSLTANNTGLKGLRMQVNFAANSASAQTASVNNVYVWGNKHSGETPDDIVFLESDGTTEWPNDDDWGDENAGGSAVTHTYYVKNSSATKTANSVTVAVSGSDSAQWSVSLDNVSFGSSQSVGNLAAGATQVVYFRFTPPSPAGGVYRPYAAYLEADVASWT